MRNAKQTKHFGDGLWRWVYGVGFTAKLRLIINYHIYIVDYHLSRSTLIIKNHQQSSTLIKHHQSSSRIIIKNHLQSSSTIIIYHQKSSVIIIYHHLSSLIIIDHHLSSFIIIDHPLTFKGDEKPIEGIPGSGTGLWLGSIEAIGIWGQGSPLGMVYIQQVLLL